MITDIGRLLENYSFKDIRDPAKRLVENLLENSFEPRPTWIPWREKELIETLKEQLDHNKADDEYRRIHKLHSKPSECSWAPLIRKKNQYNKNVIPETYENSRQLISKSFNSTIYPSPSSISLLQQNLQRESGTLSESLIEKDKTERGFMRSIKVRVYPSRERRELFKKLFGYQRKFYNTLLEEIKRTNYIYSRQNLRNNFVKPDMTFGEENSRLDNSYVKVPRQFRDNILLGLLDNIKSNFAKNNPSGFEIKRKTKKACNESIEIVAREWNRSSSGDAWYYKTFRKGLKFKDRSKELPDVNHTIRLLRTSYNKYYLCIPISYSEEDLLENQEGIIVSDPGERVFLTSRSTRTNSVQDIGTNCREKIRRLMKPVIHIENEIKRRKDSGKFFHERKKRYKLQKVKKKRLEKIHNVVEDFHKHIAKNFCENNSLILIPKLNFHGLTKLNKTSKKVLQTMGHCKLVDRLKTKSNQYRNCKVQVVREEYTSKACSNCGNINYSLGSSKHYHCSKCGFEEDRDHNATTNILYKFLNEKISLLKLGTLIGI